MKRGFKIQNIGIFEEKDSFFIPKMQLVKKIQEIRSMPESKHSFYSGPFPASDLSQAWMWSKRGLSLSWVWLVSDKAHQHCTGGQNTQPPQLFSSSLPTSLEDLKEATSKRSIPEQEKDKVSTSLFHFF